MWAAVRRYVRKRRRGFVQSAAFLCGSYVVTSYVSQRLEEFSDKMRRNKLARDNLRRRFQSTHDDVCFTIMALIPRLASQVLEEMDVEALTNELQSLSRASRSRTVHPSQNEERSQSVSSVSDVHSDPGAASFSSYSGSIFDGGPSTTSGSWVEHAQSPTRSDAPAQLSDSVISTGSSASNMEHSGTSAGPRTKGQLWNEVKILALTRTLTTLYTITLLSLLTAVQLNLLGRSRYVDSVRASERTERAREDVPHFSATEVLAREAAGKLVDVEAFWHAWALGEDEDEDGDEEGLDTIPEETEMRFLTLSWWILHVGWKDIAARVRSSVESVFDDVSLKAKLSASELSSLIIDVRRRVEMDGTGTELGERFMSSLLPPTPETIAHVLAQGGALSIPREGEFPGMNRSRATSPPRDPIRPSRTHGDVRSPASSPKTNAAQDGSSRAAAIPLENPIPRPTAFPTPPSPQAHDSVLSSRASRSPSNSSVPRHLPAQPEGIFDSLATSRATLDIDPRFNTLLAQTRRYLSGLDFAHALLCALDRATEVLMDGLRARVFVDSTSAVNVPTTQEAQAPSTTGDVDAGAEKDEVRIRLAGLLPGLTRWCQLALNATPNELVDNVMAVKEVNALEAIIMSDYADRFPAIS